MSRARAMTRKGNQDMSQGDRFLFVFGAAALAALGCGSGAGVGTEGTAGEDHTGQITLALTSTVAGTTYVLANATFLVERVQPPPTPDEIGSLRLHAT